MSYGSTRTDPDTTQDAGAAPAAGRWLSWWPLAIVLVVQGLLSARLTSADTAFQDEALYLWAGHREWAGWLHGAPVPPFAEFFSGAPVLYPPLGALADSAGGLAAARYLSLAFMLATTVLLYSAGRRLFGTRAAFFAAALFALAGPTLHLGAFATYDPLSVLLLAVSAWCVVRAAGTAEATGWMVGAGVAMAAANATAYATAILDPVIVLLVLATLPRPAPRKAAATRCATLVTVAATLLLAGVLLGGRPYLHGISMTTLARAGGADGPGAVAAAAWSWTGLITVIAIGGAVLGFIRHRWSAPAPLLALLAVAALLVPAEQALLHTTASLNKHVAIGAWLAALAAGYAVDQFVDAAPAQWNRLTTGATAAALVFPAALGATQSWQMATSWPNSGSFTAVFGQLVAANPGRLLVEDPSIAEYYLPAGTQWQRWSSTRNIVLPDGSSVGSPSSRVGVTGAGDPATFARYIRRGYFTLVALNYADTMSLDHAIAADLKSSGQYRVVQVIPYGTGTYVIYRYEPRP